MNYIWTIQKKDIANLINSTGIYYPNFSTDRRRSKSAYQFVLNCFNEINGSNYEGLIFAFAKEDDKHFFQNITQLYEYFINNPLITDAFDLWNESYVILQLQYDESINMIPVDFNDFIQIIPPVWDANAYKIICSRMKQGVFCGGYTLPSFTQIHLPYIKKDNVVSVHANFNKLESDQTGVISTYALD